MDFWWELWPKHSDDPTDRQRERMQEAMTVAWEQGVHDPATFFDMLDELGYEVHSSDWDEWRDWYNTI